MRPALPGFSVAAAIIYLLHLFYRAAEAPRAGPWVRSAVFVTGSALFVIGIAVEDRLPLRFAYVMLVVFFAYAAVGNLRQWPGFRPPDLDDEAGDDDEADNTPADA